MAMSAVMVLNMRGEIVIFRAYRDGVSRETADAFRSQVVAKLETSTAAPVQLLDGTSFLSTRHKDLLLLAMCKSNANPALVFEFLYQLGRILEAYLGPGFSEDDIRSNFTLVYELLDETLDFGYPQSCSIDVLKLYINLGNVKAQTTEKSAALTAQITGAIDWRKQDLKYRNNEVYLSVTEEVSLLVSTDGTVLSSEVTGQVRMKTYLSGMPECRLGLNDKLILDREGQGSFVVPKSSTSAQIASEQELAKRRAVSIADCTFHRCVKLGKFDADRTITFVPPDGEFELMKYRITENVQLPFRVVPVVEEVGKTKVLYNLRLSAEFSEKKFANAIVIKVPCPSNTAKAKPFVSKGRAKYDPTQQCIVWRIRRVAGGAEATFSCTAELTPNTREKTWSRPPIQMDFSVPMYTSSGLVVRFLRIVEKSGYNTSKWVKYVTKASGSYQIRI